MQKQILVVSQHTLSPHDGVEITPLKHDPKNFGCFTTPFLVENDPNLALFDPFFDPLFYT